MLVVRGRHRVERVLAERLAHRAAEVEGHAADDVEADSDAGRDDQDVVAVLDRGADGLRVGQIVVGPADAAERVFTPEVMALDRSIPQPRTGTTTRKRGAT